MPEINHLGETETQRRWYKCTRSCTAFAAPHPYTLLCFLLCLIVMKIRPTAVGSQALHFPMPSRLTPLVPRIYPATRHTALAILILVPLRQATRPEHSW